MKKPDSILSCKYVLPLLVIVFVLACGASAPEPPNVPATSTMLSLRQTQAVLDVTVQAYQAAQTEAARPPTSTPTLPPTPTSTPGPTIIQDDFSADTGRWSECSQCKIENGALQMGPYPIATDGGGYLAICKDCGKPQDYKMGVDATFIDGYTDRGFGLLLREDRGTYIDLEITTWQVYGSWFFNSEKKSWGSLLTNGWQPTGSLYPGTGTNRVEAEIASSGGKSNISIKINGQLINTTTMPAVTGRVGLVVGLHSLGVRFDNFYFEGYTTTQQPNSEPSDPSKSG